MNLRPLYTVGAPGRTALALCVVAIVSAGALPARADPSPGAGALRVEMRSTTTRVGEDFDARVLVHTETPFDVFALRIEAAPDLVRIRSWTFGEAIQRHIALHGDPPACDIIVYPDGSRFFAVMVLDPPFSSDEYGSEAFVLDLAVEAESPVATCVLYSGAVPDYEPGDDLLSVMSRLGPARECAPVIVLPSPSFRRGDVDGDGRGNISDAINILQYLFADGRDPRCTDAADSNDDGRVDISDCVLILRALFLGSPAPWTSCDVDRTRDSSHPAEGLPADPGGPDDGS